MLNYILIISKIISVINVNFYRKTRKFLNINKDFELFGRHMFVDKIIGKYLS